MDKNNKRYLAIGIATVAVYTVIAFVVPFLRTGTFFIAYIFGLIAICVLTAVCIRVNGSKEPKSKFLGWAIIDVAVKYSITQLIISLIFMIFANFPTWIITVISVVLIAACGVGLIAADAAKEEIERIDRITKEKVFYIRELQSETECLILKTEDMVLKKNLKDVAERIRYSDPMTSDELYGLEMKIKEKVYMLQDLVEKGDIENSNKLCKEIQSLLIERNSKCLFLK